jgi:hypothetical protein
VVSPSLHDALDFRNNAAQNRVDGHGSAIRGNEPERAEIGRLTPFSGLNFSTADDTQGALLRTTTSTANDRSYQPL